jgi:hypothetical protein
MAHTPHPFENQIFDHYRQKAKEINEAIELLIEHNYTVVNLEGQILNKETILNENKPIISPTRYSQRNKE